MKNVMLFAKISVILLALYLCISIVYVHLYRLRSVTIQGLTMSEIISLSLTQPIVDIFGNKRIVLGQRTRNLSTLERQQSAGVARLVLDGKEDVDTEFVQKYFSHSDVVIVNEKQKSGKQWSLVVCLESECVVSRFKTSGAKGVQLTTSNPPNIQKYSLLGVDEEENIFPLVFEEKVHSSLLGSIVYL